MRPKTPVICVRLPWASVAKVVVLARGSVMLRSTDFLLFEDTERGPDDELRLQFDVIARLDEEEKRVIRELIDGMILKYQARRWAGSAPTPAPAKKVKAPPRARAHAA